MLVRLSQKLNAKLKAGMLRALPLHENPLADWSAHLFIVDRTHYILLSNTKSLYSAVLYGRGITDDSDFIEQALSSIRELLEDDGQGAAYARWIAPASASIRFAKALDRSVTGSMNELMRCATYWLADRELSPREVSARLNDILLSALAVSKSAAYGRPREAFKALVSSVESGRNVERQ
jgi:hypothetical protein